MFVRRGEGRVIAIASNASFSEWKQTFTGPPPRPGDRRAGHLQRAHRRDRNPVVPVRPDRSPVVPVRPDSAETLPLTCTRQLWPASLRGDWPQPFFRAGRQVPVPAGRHRLFRSGRRGHRAVRDLGRVGSSPRTCRGRAGGGPPRLQNDGRRPPAPAGGSARSKWGRVTLLQGCESHPYAPLRQASGVRRTPCTGVRRSACRQVPGCVQHPVAAGVKCSSNRGCLAGQALIAGVCGCRSCRRSGVLQVRGRLLSILTRNFLNSTAGAGGGGP